MQKRRSSSFISGMPASRCSETPIERQKNKSDFTQAKSNLLNLAKLKPMAERVGFEPTVQYCRTPDFESEDKMM